MSLPRGTFPSAFSVGDYIGNNFDELKRYLTVMHQNGRSIYNVDQNEKQFINDTWQRRLMQNVAGDAAVEDAFQIVGTGADNDFQIVGGDNAPATPKNAFVGGFMPIADANTTFLLHNTQYNEGLGATPVPLTTPSGGNRTDKVYLEVFLKEVTFLDDPFLLPDNLKVALTTRLRLIQEVKVAEGGSIPASPFTDAGGVEHFLFPLATIERFDGQDAITEFDVTDNRRTFTFGILANGGLALIDPGGMQAAIDNTSGATPSAGRHVLLGADIIQTMLDNANASDNILTGLQILQDALNNLLGGPPSATNGVVLEDGLDGANVNFTSTSGLTSTKTGPAIDEVNTALANVKLLTPLIYSQCGYPVVTELNVRYKVPDRTGFRILDSSSELILDTTTVGANGLDTGVLLTNSIYQVFAISDPTQNLPDAVIASLSDVFGDDQNATLESNLPAGYTLYKWLHHFITDGSANILPSTVSNRKIKFLISTTRNALTTTGSADSLPANYGVGSLLPINHTRMAKIIFHTTQASLAYGLPPGSTVNPTTSDAGFLITNTTDQSNPSQEFDIGMDGTGVITLSGIPNNTFSARGIAVMGCEYFH